MSETPSNFITFYEYIESVGPRNYQSHFNWLQDPMRFKRFEIDDLNNNIASFESYSEEAHKAFKWWVTVTSFTYTNYITWLATTGQSITALDVNIVPPEISREITRLSRFYYGVRHGVAIVMRSYEIWDDDEEPFGTPGVPSMEETTSLIRTNNEPRWGVLIKHSNLNNNPCLPYDDLREADGEGEAGARNAAARIIRDHLNISGVTEGSLQVGETVGAIRRPRQGEPGRHNITICDLDLTNMDINFLVCLNDYIWSFVNQTYIELMIDSDLYIGGAPPRVLGIEMNDPF